MLFFTANWNVTNAVPDDSTPSHQETLSPKAPRLPPTPFRNLLHCDTQDAVLILQKSTPSSTTSLIPLAPKKSNLSLHSFIYSLIHFPPSLFIHPLGGVARTLPLEDRDLHALQQLQDVENNQATERTEKTARKGRDELCSVLPGKETLQGTHSGAGSAVLLKYCQGTRCALVLCGGSTNSGAQ